MSDLADRGCEPCRSSTPVLTVEEIQQLHGELDGWSIEGGHELRKDFAFGDFATAHLFVNRVAKLADGIQHHPEICFTYGRARLTIFTHAVDGLTVNDFILAARIDRLRPE